MLATNPKIMGSLVITKLRPSVSSNQLRKYIRDQAPDVIALKRMKMGDFKEDKSIWNRSEPWKAFIGVSSRLSLWLILHLDYSQLCLPG